MPRAKKRDVLEQLSVAPNYSAQRKATSEPCNGCPYRRKSMKGWLGAASPEEFMTTTLQDYPMPCHKTIDYEDPAWKEKWEAGKVGKLCAGALSFFANMGKLSRERGRAGKADNKIFKTPDEFLEHHNSATIKSWEM